MSQLLPFNLGLEIYALELADVQEVVEHQAVFPLPGVATTISGAIGFHGRIVPVVDLPLLLGFDAGPRSDRMIVLTDVHGPVALSIDRLQRIITLDLAHCTLSQSESEEDCIRGVIDRDGEMISLLDLEQLRLVLDRVCSETGG
ncbi:purine-binding chemotaxis protein CheW [Malonomonas rubra DSM 5091]|uniref:Purine-binding chemotaxis protein CheW n=1 Tax=Malonomonas rubra DSM 5091 TaxID=1122189 RepID=A0A1M6JXW7_MALRU|nr:chemotaxis protein CheW [Malonomonas rubra]SHJ51481.1 purine-binding chemotaxis protein CheW [Malonomonas rubra DSM 5091]